mmetsp:Transcript_19262/g.72760  ORF Transcript_19262/g.72760 Transcript_19262/m.72760 type:complete len:137 (+) Transcript_19262:237-647(+)|eukprot:scaffold7085_cov329-Pinguiococcus_pyrenoidosus.AAC.2
MARADMRIIPFGLCDLAEGFGTDRECGAAEVGALANEAGAGLRSILFCEVAKAAPGGAARACTMPDIRGIAAMPSIGAIACIGAMGAPFMAPRLIDWFTVGGDWTCVLARLPNLNLDPFATPPSRAFMLGLLPKSL